MEDFVALFCCKYQWPVQTVIMLMEKMERVVYTRGECLVREGELNTDFHLIAEGIWRGHYLRDGVDLSVWFASRGEALFSTWGYVAGRPARVTIEAMSTSTIYRIPKAKLEAFFSSSVECANLGRRLFEHDFMTFEEELINGGATQAKERYLALLERNPQLLQHVPLKHIASYLYVTPQSLSRIRSELVKNKK